MNTKPIPYKKRRTSKDGWKIEDFCIEYAKL